MHQAHKCQKFSFKIIILDKIYLMCLVINYLKYLSMYLHLIDDDMI
jgi:hypothetical protein